MERKWREHVECVLRKDICMRRSKAVISTQYPRLYIHSIRNSHRHATGLMGSHQSMQTMPRCQWISLWGRYATHSTKCSPSPSLSLSLPHQATPITDIDAKQRRRRKMKIEKQAAALVEQKITKTTSTRKKYNKKKHKKKYNKNSNNGKHSNINL